MPGTHATAEGLRAAATAKPSLKESEFNKKTGVLRVGDVEYRALKYTNARKERFEAFEKEIQPNRLLSEAAKIQGKLEQIPGEKPGMMRLRDPDNPFTDEEQALLSENAKNAADFTFQAIPLLYVDADGNPPTEAQLREELHDNEAAQAVAYAQLDPTARKTAGSSD